MTESPSSISITKLKNDINVKKQLLSIANDQITNLEDALAEINQKLYQDNPNSKPELKLKQDILMLKQRAIGLHEAVSTIAFTPNEQDTIATSIAISESKEQYSSMTMMTKLQNGQNETMRKDAELQKVLHTQLSGLSRLLDMKIGKLAKDVSQDENEATDDNDEHSSDKVITLHLEKQLTRLQQKSQNEAEREKKLMKQLKQLLAVLSRKSAQEKKRQQHNRPSNDDSEDEDDEVLLKHENQINLKIVQNLLNGMMTNENEGFVRTSDLLGSVATSSKAGKKDEEGGDAVPVAHPLIRQLLKANIITESGNLDSVKLRAYGLDFDS